MTQSLPRTHPHGSWYVIIGATKANLCEQVDVKFVSRVEYPPTLHLIKHIASLNSLPDEINYIGTVGLKALKEMGLVNRGRLSVYSSESVVQLIMCCRCPTCHARGFRCCRSAWRTRRLGESGYEARRQKTKGQEAS
jgi:hypothetical protein